MAPRGAGCSSLILELGEEARVNKKALTYTDLIKNDLQVMIYVFCKQQQFLLQYQVEKNEVSSAIDFVYWFYRPICS